MLSPLLALLSLALAVVALKVHLAWKERLREYQRKSTDQTRSIAALKEHIQAIALQARAQERALFNSLVEGCLYLDRVGRIRTANPALLRVFGIEENIEGRTLSEALREHALLAAYEETLQHGAIRDFEIELSGKRVLAVNGSVIHDDEGRQYGSIFLFHDLTRVKELENLRKDFVANVSHELRTPLTLIKGYVETLLSGTAEDPALREKFLRIIEKHTNRLTFLIEDLLALSKLESGAVVLNLEPVPLHSLVKSVFEDYSALAAQRGVRVLNDVPEDFVVCADAPRLQQVLSNLVENALKYGRPGGEVRAGAALHNGKRVFWVQDDGPGVTAEAKPRLFERFYRVDKARSREQGGTGLGLAIVKHIVQTHGGEVWVESEPGKGAKFVCAFPSDKGPGEPTKV